MALTKQQAEALTGFADAAVHSERRYGVPAELTVAQAVLESGWGRRVFSNNCLGIKTSARHPQCCIVTTTEVFTPEAFERWKKTRPGRASLILDTLADGSFRVQIQDTFAAYESLNECFEDHAVLLTERAPYKAMLAAFDRHDNLRLYVEQVGKRYATDPTYSKQCLAIMSMRPVQDALAAARKAAE